MSRLDTLRKLRELLTEEVWVNHSPHDEKHHCLATAEFAVDHGAWSLQPLIEQAIAELYPHRISNYITFNDHPDTTYQDILRVLARTEELVREQEAVG